ncbi:MAG: hypothetical protein ACKOF9_01085 [Burkholderiales bacterium]
MKILNLQLRFLLPLVVTLVVAAYVALPVMDQLTLHWFARDLNSRGMLIANTLSEPIMEALADGKTAKLRQRFDRVIQDERLFALGVCSSDDKLLQGSTTFPKLSCSDAQAASDTAQARLPLAGGAVQVGVHVLTGEAGASAKLVVLHDLSFIERRSQDTRQYLMVFITALGLTIALITMLVAHLSWRGWVVGVKGLLRGEGLFLPWVSQPEISPLAAELRTRLRDLEDEYRRALGPQTHWDPDRLRALLRSQLRGDQVIVVSNREPYIHENLHDKQGDRIVVKRPASGLVTAVEPVMRACSGTWIAHGSGSADRQVVDVRDRVGVPPGKNEYMLRRLWLTAEEEAGYYFGKR